MQKQYRPPLDKIVIEVPAGLVDAGESAEQAAVRELKEETGYVGVVSESSPVMYNGINPPSLPLIYSSSRSTYLFFLPLLTLFWKKDPGFCNTNLKMIHVTIDMNDSRNQDLKPELEDSEFIEVFTLPLKELWEACGKWEEEGYVIDARVGTLAEGIEVARQWKL